MEFLRLLEGLRTDFGDKFFSTITMLGEETIFIVIGMLFFWCLNKKKGYYLLTVGFLGVMINQFLKVLCRVPRPWVKDPDFTIVESARAEATGYSFPSGHTQGSVGLFGAIARGSKKYIVRILCILACILVPLSRMYLGVHTPLDVGVSIVIAVTLIFVLYPIIDKAVDNPKMMRIVLGVMSSIAVVFIAIIFMLPAFDKSDAIAYENSIHGLETLFKMLGCVLGIWVAYEVDNKYIHFSTEAVWWAQIIKFVVGFVLVFAIKEGLKVPLEAICPQDYIADGIRYLFVCGFAGGVWPLTFKYFGSLGKKS